MANLKSRVKDLVEEFNSHFEHFYFDGLYLYAKDDDELEGVLKYHPCAQSGKLMIKVYIDKSGTFTDSIMVDTANLTDPEERVKIQDTINQVREVLLDD